MAQPSSMHPYRTALVRQIGRRKARQVISLANKGERHPDPEVADVATRWAEAVLASAPVLPTAFSKQGWLITTIATVITFGWAGNLNQALAARTDRRAAAAILAVGQSR
jgi:hypothetical protein